jgi:hypothetical protein
MDQFLKGINDQLIVENLRASGMIVVVTGLPVISGVK